MFIHVMKWLQNGPIQCLGLWTWRIPFEGSMGTCFKHFFKQRVSLGRVWQFKCLPGKEGEAAWLVGRRKDECECKISLTLTVMALQGQPLLLPQSFLLVPCAVLAAVPCTLCHSRTCGTSFPSCSSVIVSIQPVTQQLIAVSIPSNEEAAGADEVFSILFAHV